MSRKNFRETLISLFTFSPKERRTILLLLPLLAVTAILIAVLAMPRFETGLLERADDIIDGRSGAEPSMDGAGTSPGGGHFTGDYPGPEVRPDTELFFFDPNTVTLQELVSLGFSARTAAGIIKYRERGKRFEIPEDFATCYGVTVEQYTLLEPYIIIGDEFRVNRAQGRSGREPYGGSSRQDGYGGLASRESAAQAVYDTLRPFDPNALSADEWTRLGFSPAQAAAIIRYRESMGGFRSAQDLARCYVVSGTMMERLEPFLDIPAPEGGTSQAGNSGEDARDLYSRPLELNTADSAALRSVSGIGEVLVVRIMEYRERLGGFARVEQLAEVRGMTEVNYERIVKQIWVDSCEIQKIDINFADHKFLVERLGVHPYMDRNTLRKILKERQLKGGWSSIGELTEQNILSQKQAERLAPYFVFTTL